MIFFILSIPIIVKSQSNYYWSENRKIYLDVDSSQFVVQINDNLEENSIRNEIAKKSEIQDYQEKNFCGKKVLIFKNSKRDNKKFSLVIKSIFNDINTVYPILKLGNKPFYPTNQIILQPKLGIEIESIIQKFKNYDIKLVKSTKWGSHIIEIKNVNLLLTIANLIYESDLVEWCHPNFVVEIEKTNDPIYSEQYYLNNTGQFGGTSGIDINAPEAWQITTGNNSIRVAVIDDGVEDHVELTGRVVQGFTPVFNGNGAPVNFSDGHGQACAGIIAASHNNQDGIRGIAPNVIIVPINIFAGSESTADLAEAINWAWDPDLGNADILSNSWGYNTTSQTAPGFDAIIQAITNARTLGRENKGSVVVFASGNSNQGFSGVTFPANVNGVITVGSINKSGLIWNYSSRGPEMDLVAPSGDVNLNGDVRTIDRMGSSGYETGNYTTRFGGTSAACPQVAGVAALMISVNENLRENEIREILRHTATDMGVSCFDNIFGSGRVNARSAVEASMSYITNLSEVCANSSSFFALDTSVGGNITWQATPSSFFQLSSGFGTGASLIAASSSVQGEATITYSIRRNRCNSTMTISRNFWVGIPQTASVITGSTNPNYNSNQTYSINAIPGGSTTLDWMLPPPPSCPAPPVNATFGPCTQWSIIGNENTINLSTQVGPIGGYVRVRGVNQCGTGLFSSLFVSVSNVNSIYCPCGYNNGGGTPMAAMVYPNPSSSELNIDFTTGTDSLSYNSEEFTEPYQVTLQNDKLVIMFDKVTKEKIVKIETVNIPDGIYYLIIKNKSGLYSHHIQIKH